MEHRRHRIQRDHFRFERVERSRRSRNRRHTEVIGAARPGKPHPERLRHRARPLVDLRQHVAAETLLHLPQVRDGLADLFEMLTCFGLRHRQVDDQRRDAVAESAALGARAQVDRHHGADTELRQLDVAAAQESAHRAGRGRERHVVTRAAETRADRAFPGCIGGRPIDRAPLDRLRTQGIRRRAKHPVEDDMRERECAGAKVGARRPVGGQDAQAIDQLDRRQGVVQHVVEQQAQSQRRPRGAMQRRILEHRRRFGGEQCADKVHAGDAIDHGVMRLEDDGKGVIAETVHKHRFPQRLGAVQREREDVACQPLQRFLAAAGFERYAADVRLRVEAAVIDPDRTARDGRAHELLAAARPRRKARKDVAFELVEIEPAFGEPERRRLEDRDDPNMHVQTAVLVRKERSVLRRQRLVGSVMDSGLCDGTSPIRAAVASPLSIVREPPPSGSSSTTR